jgi:hypothetical protein
MNPNKQIIIPMAALLLWVLNADGQPINPMLVGNNVWLNPSDKVWELTKECGVGSVRIGGGAYDRRMPSKTQLLNWVTRIQAMEGEPIMQVSQYGTPQAAADLVKYFNVEKSSGRPIKYWNVGNEPWLQAKKPAIPTVGAMVAAYFKPIAAAMKEVDPTIKIYGPDECYYMEEAINDLFGGKNDLAGKVPGKDYAYCDGISWHRYPQDNNINLAIEGVKDFERAIIKCKGRVDYVNRLHNRTGDQALGWGIGEYNAKGGPLVHTWENGQMFGAVLGLCMKHEATYATTWSMFENGGSRRGSDFSSIDGNMVPRASYRHMEFVAKHFKGVYADGKSSDKNILVFGSKNADIISVLILNRVAGPPVVYQLHLDNKSVGNTNAQLNVDAGSRKQYDDIITGRSTQLVLFQGDQIIKYTYTSQDFDNNQPPVRTTAE